MAAEAPGVEVALRTARAKSMTLACAVLSFVRFVFMALGRSIRAGSRSLSGPQGLRIKPLRLDRPWGLKQRPPLSDLGLGVGPGKEKEEGPPSLCDKGVCHLMARSQGCKHGNPTGQLRETQGREGNPDKRRTLLGKRLRSYFDFFQGSAGRGKAL